MRLRKLNATEKNKYATGTCITEMQMQLKKEVEMADLELTPYGNSIVLDLNPASKIKKKKEAKKLQNEDDDIVEIKKCTPISIDDLIMAEDRGDIVDSSYIFKK